MTARNSKTKWTTATDPLYTGAFVARALGVSYRRALAHRRYKLGLWTRHWSLADIAHAVVAFQSETPCRMGTHEIDGKTHPVVYLDKDGATWLSPTFNFSSPKVVGRTLTVETVWSRHMAGETQAALFNDYEIDDPTFDCVIEVGQRLFGKRSN